MVKKLGDKTLDLLEEHEAQRRTNRIQSKKYRKYKYSSGIYD